MNELYYLSESYNSNHLLRLLIRKLIPFGDEADSALNKYYENLQKSKVTEFFNCLDDGQIKLTEEVIGSDDFLHKYFITVRCVLENSRLEKTKYYASLLNNSCSGIFQENKTYYDDFLKVLDDLSLYEIKVLHKIDERQGEKVPHLMTRRLYFREIRKEISEEFSISEDEVMSTFIRLERTGCVRFEQNSTQGNDNFHALGITDFYKKLKILISD